VIPPPRFHWRSRGAALILAVLAGACGNAPAGGLGSGSGATGVGPDVIRVGGIAAISGPLGDQWSPAFQGAKAYFDMVNSAGGVHGRRIELVAELDDQTDPSSDIAAARQLVEKDGVFAVIPVATPVFSGGRYLAQHDVPTFGWNVNPEWGAGPTMFGHNGSYTDPTAVDVAGPFLAGRIGAHRVAVLAYAVSQSAACARGQKLSFEKFGFPVVLDDSSLPIGVANVDADISRIRRSGADFVVTCMDPTGSTIVSAGLARAGLSHVAQYWLDGYDHATLEKFPREYEGVYLTTDFVPFEDAGLSPGMTQYLSEMRSHYPKAAIGQVSLAGWVSAAMFVEGLQRAGRDLTRHGLVEAINSLTEFTANGIETPVNWRTDHTQAGSTNCSVYLQVRGGRFITLFGNPFVCLSNSAATTAALTPIAVPGVPGSSAAGGSGGPPG